MFTHVLDCLDHVVNSCQVRLESIEAVNKILEEANKRIQPTGTGMTLFCLCIPNIFGQCNFAILLCTKVSWWWVFSCEVACILIIYFCLVFSGIVWCS